MVRIKKDSLEKRLEQHPLYAKQMNALNCGIFNGVTLLLSRWITIGCQQIVFLWSYPCTIEEALFCLILQ